MPEGHTIHRLARDQGKVLRGSRPLLSSPQGRFSDGAALLSGREVERLDPYGKHLFYGFAGRLWLHVHLGLYGGWQTGPQPAPEPRGALRLRVETDDVWMDLRGPTACEVVTPAEKRAVEQRLGPDPLAVRGARADPGPFVERMTRSRVTVGQQLMDQSVVAGVGNVYRAEVLFRHGLHPWRPGRDLREADVLAVWEDLRVLLRDGVRTGRIVTTRPDDRDRPRGRVRREDAHYVYRRHGLPCRVCGTEVRTEVMAGRNLFWCPHCQPA